LRNDANFQSEELNPENVKLVAKTVGMVANNYVITGVTILDSASKDDSVLASDIMVSKDFFFLHFLFFINLNLTFF
jgi:hypothetical protein